MTFSYMGAELGKGRNIWAETSGGQIRKGPKPLATLWTYPYFHGKSEGSPNGKWTM